MNSFYIKLDSFLAISSYLIFSSSIVSSNSDETQSLNQQQLETLKNQYNRLKCVVMRQMAYATTTYQTKAMAYLLSEGQSVTLESWLCLLPHQTDQVTVRWKFLSLDGAAITFIEERGDKYFIQGTNKGLTIIDLQVEDTGFYFANVNFKTDIAVYLIEVSNDDELAGITHKRYDKFYEPPEILIPNLNLIVFLRMGDWTPCSRCDRIGVKYRSGTCFVKQYKSNPLKEKTYSIFDLFMSGLPCRSQFLPLEIKEMKQVKDTRSIILKNFCRKQCPTTPPPSEKLESEKWGKVKYEIENRFFSMKEFKRSIVIAQKTIFQVKQKGVIIKCPKRINGHMHFHMPVVWKCNNTFLIPENIQQATKNRIYIDPTGKIRIKQALLQDSGEYSCWQNERQIGNVRLIIQDRLELPDDVTYTMSVLSFGAMALVGIIFAWNLFTTRHTGFT